MRSRFARLIGGRFSRLGVGLLLACSLVPAIAQGPSGQAGADKMAAPSTADRLTKLEAQVADAKSSADNSWMLTSSALVLMMTGPGLALFYSGLVRKKNVLSVMMQSFAMMAIVTTLWAFVSYSLAFDSGSSFIGGLHHVFLRGVGLTPDNDYSTTLPLQTWMIYQLMFAIITPALITGAFAERMKFSAMAVFLTLWSIMIYSKMAHMVSVKAGLLNASLGGRFPTLDFAGGTVVHITSGVSALVCALYLGKRVGYPKEAMMPHSVVLSLVGACLLWVAGYERVCQYPLRSCGGGAWMVGCGVDPQREAISAGCDFGCSGGPGCDYAGRGVCAADVGTCDWGACWSLLLLHGGQGQGNLRLRRFARCVRRSWGRRNHGCIAHRHLCQ